MRFARKTREIEPIPTASIADISFLLLTFFMISAVFVKYRRGPAELPEAQNAQKVLEQRNIIHLWLDQEGGVNINGQSAPLDQVAAIVGAQLKANPQQIVSIHVDGKISFGSISDILQELRKAEADKIVFATEKKGGAP